MRPKISQTDPTVMASSLNLSRSPQVENLKRVTHQLAWAHCVAEDGGGSGADSGFIWITLILLRYQACQRWRRRLLCGPGQGRKLARPRAGQAPLGLAGCSLELAKRHHAELSSRDSGLVPLSCFPPTLSVGLSRKSPDLPPPHPPPPAICFPPSLTDLGNFEMHSTVLSEIQKVLCFPGG